MSLNSYIKAYKCATPPADFTTSTIGGGPSATEINAGLLEEVHFKMSSALSGGGDRVQISKYFLKNTHSTEPLTEAKVYLPLSVDDWGVNDTTAVVQGVTTDDDDKFVRFIGHDTAGDPIQYDVNIDGTNQAASSDTLTAFQSWECRSQSTGALTAVSAGNRLDVYRGGVTKLGSLLELYYSGSSGFQIWLPASLDDTTTTVDAATDPSGASWSKPNLESAAISVANSGSLTAGAAQGVWSKWTLPETTKPRSDIQVLTGLIGDDTL